MGNPTYVHGVDYPLEPDELEAVRRAMRDRMTHLELHGGPLEVSQWLAATFGPRMINAGYRWLVAGVAP